MHYIVFIFFVRKGLLISPFPALTTTTAMGRPAAIACGFCLHGLTVVHTNNRPNLRNIYGIRHKCFSFLIIIGNRIGRKSGGF